MAKKKKGQKSSDDRDLTLCLNPETRDKLLRKMGVLPSTEHPQKDSSGTEKPGTVEINTEHTTLNLFELPDVVEQMAARAKARLIREGVLEDDMKKEMNTGEQPDPQPAEDNNSTAEKEQDDVVIETDHTKLHLFQYPDSMLEIAEKVRARLIRQGIIRDHGRLKDESPGSPPAGPPPPREGAAQAGTMTAALPGWTEMALVWIPPGTFLMGSPESEEGRDRDEGPPHAVTISRGFWLGQNAVTQGQWEAVMGSNPSRFKEATRPVEQVSWNNVQAFIGKLNAAEGRAVYRLPTEAEWEYACRAGTTTRYSFGDDESPLGEYAWWKENSEGCTHPVGEKKPNPWGLYDLHGNVWEWCQDRYGRYASGPQTDPTGPTKGSPRVGRGGSWRHEYPSRLRGANRSWFPPGYRYGLLGFRLARTES